MSLLDSYRRATFTRTIAISSRIVQHERPQNHVHSRLEHEWNLVLVNNTKHLPYVCCYNTETESLKK